MIRKLMTGLALVGTCGMAQAQTGVSDDRVSLPAGPGSLEGIGENISLDPNMGVLNYGVGIDVPAGFAGVTPSLRLAYSSGGGSSLVGVGWGLNIPHIERSTFKGLPRYTADDRFTANGGTQLVRLPGADAVYRARFEGGFIKHTWIDAGSDGYWRSEYPDGRVATFGADANGTLVPSARVSGPDGTFRYMLVDTVDVYGHRMRHTYQSIDGYAVVRQIDYVFTDDAPEYSVSFNYEDRSDETGIDILSDAKAGFEERITQRLSAINVFSKDDRIRRYELAYEQYADSGGFTRLSSVSTIGLNGTTYPAVQRFGWSENLGAQQPFVIDMGNIGVNIGVGRATFIDINGDALPDLVDTSDDGAHTFRLNVPSVDGQARFSNDPIASAIGEGSGFRLSTPFVQVLDVNGDGFADLLDARNGRALINRGGGDWDRLEPLGGTDEVSDALGAGFDAEDGSLATLRFVDIDNDKQIDLMRSTREETRIFRNRGAAGFEVLDGVDVLGYDMAVDGIQMTDMNGDGLLDAVKLNVGGLRYRLSLGYGRWGDEVEVLGLPIDESELDLATLDDINGDGLSDLIVVVGRTVKFAINRNGTVFSQVTTLTSDDVAGELPLRDATVSVLMADVNGNGSTDVVWLDAQGQVDALELFPTRPNQLARISNSLGMVTDVAYTTSVQEMARDGDWQFTLPHPMQVVSTINRTDSATGVEQRTTYRYRDGYYDGDEKQFRGFARVEIETQGDDSQEQGLATNTYDVGVEDRYHHGRLLNASMQSAGRLINTLENAYGDCPLAEVPDTEPAIRFVCMTSSNTVRIEGAAAAEHVTLRQERTYDGYGNITLNADLGVVDVGGSGCAPCVADTGGACGDACEGDELFSESEFITPGEATDGRWLLRLAARTAVFGAPGAERAETRMFYDGPDFEGLATGRATRGSVTRIARRVDADRFIDTRRTARDADGNVVEALDALAEIDGQTHRKRYTFDADGLRRTRIAVALQTPDGQPYSLVREMTYDSVFDQLASLSAWRIYDANGAPQTPANAATLQYDEFNRLISISQPDDAPNAPAEVHEHLLGDPVSRVIVRNRSQVGGPLDMETITCMDGRGRALQTRTQIADGRYLVSGLSIYNVQGQPFRLYQPFESSSADCDVAEPENVLFNETRRDALGRTVQEIQPDAAIFGDASVQRLEYSPMAITMFDREDTDPNSPHADTPTRVERDGLGRTISAERRLADGTAAVTRNVYDGLGRLVTVVDADGNLKRQSYDLLARLLRVEDPNKTGTQQMVYDDAGNLISVDDGRGDPVQTVYDGANRRIERFVTSAPIATLESTIWDVDPSCDAALCTNTAGFVAQQSTPGLGDAPNVSRFGYDATSRMIQASRVLEGVQMDFGFGFDNAGRAKTLTYPNGTVVNYTYDAASRVTAIEGFVDAVDYDPRGSITAIEYANGARNEMAYDAMQRLETKTIQTPTAGLLQNLGFEHDRAGNLIAIEDAAGRLEQGATFEYDAWYRTRRSLGADGRIITNTYDLKGNVLRRDGEGEGLQTQMGDYSYAVNALTQAGDMTLAYDAAGQTIERGDARLDWDAMGRLRTATTDAVESRYAYSSRHTRTARMVGDSLTLYGAPEFELHDGISTLYIRLGSSRVARVEDDTLATVALTDLAADGVDADGRITAGDAWIATADADVSPAGALLHSAVRRMFMDETDIAWLHHDHLGSLVLATDADGAVLGERAFEPTGAERADSTGYVDAFGFTGQARDPGTGFLHYAHRLLDPKTGRWLSPDPKFAWATPGQLTNPGEAMNVYSYVGNNYASYTDPTGLTRTPTGGGGSGGGSNAGGGAAPGNRGTPPALPARRRIGGRALGQARLQQVLGNGQRAFVNRRARFHRARRQAARRIQLGPSLNSYGITRYRGNARTSLRGLRPSQLRSAQFRARNRILELRPQRGNNGPPVFRQTAGGGIQFAQSTPSWRRQGAGMQGTLSASELAVNRIVSNNTPVNAGNVLNAVVNVNQHYQRRILNAEIIARVPRVN